MEMRREKGLGNRKDISKKLSNQFAVGDSLKFWFFDFRHCMYTGYLILWPLDIVTYCFLWPFCQFPFPNALFYTVALSDFVTTVLVIVTIFHLNFGWKGNIFGLHNPFLEQYYSPKQETSLNYFNKHWYQWIIYPIAFLYFTRSVRTE